MELLYKEKVSGMLLQFKVSNYRCFADETVLDMTATNIREHSDSLIMENGVGILPVAAVYGANASGKTSLFMAMDGMQQIITNKSLEQIKLLRKENHNLIFAARFMFDDDYNDKETAFEMCFVIDETEYRYGFGFVNTTITSEYLYRREFSKNNTIEKMIFERTATEININDKITENMRKEIEYCASMRSDSTLLITDIGLRGKNDELEVVFLWFNNLKIIQSDNYLCEEYEQMIGRFLAVPLPQSEIINYDLIMSYLKDIDPCIIRIESVLENINNGESKYKVITTHLYNGEEKAMPLAFESAGTKKYLALLMTILVFMATGGRCFIDELDSRLHPLILRKIVRMFTDKRINKLGAQLVFSAHNIINLDSSDLRRDEIWFVEKKDHKSTLYSLYDFEDEDGSIRSDLNYGKHYLSGRFGAVPFQD
jgi:hypothetical protein